MEITPIDCWEGVESAAEEVADELGLPRGWLNRRCEMFAWTLPLGWKARCGRALVLGPLEVWLIARRDFIAARVVSAPRRPADVEDLLYVRPTADELAWAERHIDRLDMEHPDPDYPFDDVRSVLKALRGES